MTARELSTDTIEALMRTAARRSLVPHAAEDLVQDVLLATVERNRDCGDPGRVISFFQAGEKPRHS